MYHPKPTSKSLSLQMVATPCTDNQGLRLSRARAEMPAKRCAAVKHAPTNSGVLSHSTWVNIAVLVEGRTRTILSILCWGEKSVNRLLTNKPRKRAISRPPDMANNTSHWRSCFRLRRYVKQGGTGIRGQAKPLGQSILLFATEPV